MNIKLKITSGIYRSRNIICKINKDIRPTQTKQRQSVFNILGNHLEKTTFLDVCSGSGMMGFEALSRGASYVVWVDESKKALDNIYLNIKALALNDEFYRLVCSKWQNCFRYIQNLKFDYIYFDPPFIRDSSVSDIYNMMAELIKSNNILNDNGLFIIEYDNRFIPQILTDNFIIQKQKKYGSTGISFLSLR